MSDEKRDKDIQDVMREERARGKKHVDASSEEEFQKLKALYITLAKEIDDEDDFWEAITAFLPPGAAREKIVAAWRALKRPP